MSNSKTLLLCTHPANSGGVANIYRMMRPQLGSNYSYLYVGSRGGFPGSFLLPYIFFQLIITLYRGNFTTVVVNPSVAKKALVRDAFLLLVVRAFSLKTIIYFHGWNGRLLDSTPWSQLVRYLISHADKVLVLAQEFAKSINKLNLSTEVIVFRTPVDMSAVSQGSVKSERNKEDKIRVLFLGRLEKEKGVLEVVDAVLRLRSSGYANIELDIAGSGSLTHHIRYLATSGENEGLRFHGYVRDDAKARLLDSCDIFAFPTQHAEGLPLAVLEAMAYDLCIISPLVGGMRCQIGGEVIFELSDCSRETLAAALKYFADNPRELLRRQKQAGERAQYFDVESVAKDFDALVSRVAMNA